MTEPRTPASLDALLSRLAAEAALPPAPDLERAVLARIDARPSGAQPRRQLLLRAAAFAVVLVAGVAAALAVSRDAREAVADFLGLAVPGERIELARELPVEGVDLWPSTRAALEETTLEDARRALDFEPAMPTERVERVYLLTFLGLEGVVLRTERFDVWQFRNDGGVFLGKGGPEGTTSIVEVSLDGGRRGYWVTGGPRVLTVRDAAGELVTGVGITTTARALVFAHGPITYRIEGDLTLDEALAVARALLD